jgi:type III secretion system FlhB-like substrate exporter
MSAPVVLAQGQGMLAERIIEIAGSAGIPVVEDPLLADILSDAEIGGCIPAETWEAVAAIFAFLEKGTKERWFA